jgi:hypothetical protein
MTGVLPLTQGHPAEKQQKAQASAFVVFHAHLYLRQRSE